MKPFLTGSRCYGEPKEDSDVDMVLYLDDQHSKDDAVLLQMLLSHADEVKEYVPTSAAVRYGKLNIIIPRCKEQYDAWRIGTTECESKKPVTRDQAIEILKKSGVK